MFLALAISLNEESSEKTLLELSGSSELSLDLNSSGVTVTQIPLSSLSSSEFTLLDAKFVMS